MFFSMIEIEYQRCGIYGGYFVLFVIFQFDYNIIILTVNEFRVNFLMDVRVLRENNILPYRFVSFLRFPAFFGIMYLK